MLNIGKIMLHIIFLYCIYIIGNWVQTTFNLLIPGSVIGMILLFLLLSTNIIKLTWIENGARFVVDNLILFFIPATVGLINYLDFFMGEGILLIGIVLLCTALVVLTSGATSQWMMHRKERQHD